MYFFIDQRHDWLAARKSYALNQKQLPRHGLQVPNSQQRVLQVVQQAKTKDEIVRA